MNLEKLEQAVRDIVVDIDREEFIYQLLRAYDLPKASITRLKNGQYNQSKNDGEVLWKKKLCFRHEAEEDLHECIDRLKSEKRVAKRAPRFVVVTDFERILAFDTKTNDSLETLIKDLPKHSVFFLPWANLEKEQVKRGNAADERAAEKMGQLYEIIAVENEVETQEQRHALNIFLSRLLFCFFAEDTEIFASDQFTNAVASHTSEDGSDLQGYLQKLFMVLATEDRSSFPQFLQAFPYVNGGLFCEDYPVPIFNRKSRKIIIECGSLDWKAINPDIFGSMIQAVVHSEERGQMGMHYTSVVNIIKVIEPLFLNEFKEQLEKAGNNKKKLNALLDRLYNLRIFDPACGSGNFLIIAYKELCRLEIEIFGRLKGRTKEQTEFRFSRLQLTQFYGIELDDFAHETAKLSLWLTEHQMNLEFKSVFGTTRPTLPLQDGGNIVCDNATRIDWGETCPREDSTEVFILGNPPYVAYSDRDKHQKSDVDLVLSPLGKVKRLDYVACWFKKATDYISGCERSRYALVSTNSLCQGEQVSLLWPYVFENEQEIFFAHQSFKWNNSARGNAGVTCVILGIRNLSEGPKHIHSGVSVRKVTNINPYLVEGENIVMPQRRSPISEFPTMALGSSPIDGGNLLLSPSEREAFVGEDRRSEKFIRPFIGGGDILDGKKRYCLWIGDDEIEEANQIARVRERIEDCREFRVNGGRDAQKGAKIPHRFFYRKYKKKNAIVMPMTSSENRSYIPVSFVGDEVIPSHGVFVIYDYEPMMFGILSSRMHVLWLTTLSGKLESRIRYSVNLNYNTFPFPKVAGVKREAVEELVFELLDEREKYPELTLAQIYDKERMPSALLEIHQRLDLVVEKCYRNKPFANDGERLEYLFRLYESMTEKETASA